LQTLHTIITGCEAGNVEAWHAFLSEYTPPLLQIASVYRTGREEATDDWRELLKAMSAGGFKGLRELDRQSERGFLAGLRSLLLDQALAGMRAASGSVRLSKFQGDVVPKLLEGLPLLHQELLFLKLAGYSHGTLERIYRVNPAVAEKAWERLRGDDDAALLDRDFDRCSYPVEWLQFLQEVRSAHTESCPPLHLFIRIQDGQVGWHEKEPAEKHISVCAHCLEAWTALREISYWKAAAPPASPEEVQHLFSAIPLAAQERKTKSLFKRVFG
jgi:hypothetical protein